MKTIALFARYLLGLEFIVFGANGFWHFLPNPPPFANIHAGEFLGAMSATGYMAFVFGVQLACGVLLVSGFFVPLALVVLASVIVNILLFHATMDPAGIIPGAIAAGLWLIVAFRRRANFAGLYKVRVPA